MPKYFPFKVAGYYLYYTMECVIECMHVHASDARLTEGGSANFLLNQMEIRLFSIKVKYLMPICEKFRSI